jgi:hypothetical protein
MRSERLMCHWVRLRRNPCRRLVSVFCTYLNFGTISWVVTQYLAMPLRPVRVRPALREARKKWKTFAGTGLLNTITIFAIALAACVAGFAAGLILSLLSVPFAGWTKGQFLFAAVIGFLAGLIGLIVAHVVRTLVAPVVMMENLRGRTAMRRSKYLARRSVWTTVGVLLINILIPGVLAASIAFFINVTAKAFDPKLATGTEVKVGKIETTEEAKADNGQTAQQDKPADEPKKNTAFGINLGNGSEVKVEESDKDMRSRVMHTFLQSVNQVVWLPIQILVISFSAIIVALLYLKTRLSGGETMVDLMERFEDDDGPRRKWQERVRQRLIQSGRVTSKS